MACGDAPFLTRRAWVSGFEKCPELSCIGGAVVLGIGCEEPYR